MAKKGATAMWNERMNRRDFIFRSTVGTAMAVLGAPWAARSAETTGTDFKPLTLDLADKEFKDLAEVGKAIYVPHREGAKPLIVWRETETAVKVFSSECTHKGCQIGLPKDGKMTCPCHGAEFDSTGKPMKGPAKKNLKRYESTLQNNTITVTMDAAETLAK